MYDSFFRPLEQTTDKLLNSITSQLLTGEESRNLQPAVTAPLQIVLEESARSVIVDHSPSIIPLVMPVSDYDDDDDCPPLVPISQNQYRPPLPGSLDSDESSVHSEDSATPLIPNNLRNRETATSVLRGYLGVPQASLTVSAVSFLTPLMFSREF